MELVLVSQKPERVRELKKALQDALPDVYLHSIADFSHFALEDSRDILIEQRAVHAAVKAVELLSKPCLADISGLIIPVLGRDKVWTEELTSHGVYLPDTKKILRELNGVEEADRAAFLECSLAFATPENGLIRSGTCRIEGTIASAEKGRSMFDFSSIFVKYEYSKTLAELSPSVLSRISHRKKACEKLLPFLRSYFLKRPLR